MHAVSSCYAATTFIFTFIHSLISSSSLLLLMIMATPMQFCMDTPASDWLKVLIPDEVSAAADMNSSSPSDELLRPSGGPPMLERRLRPPHDHALKCPRCDSAHTKFCYYNNYSLSQPRYFCKTCRRYWTKGGSLRNVPVGGGCRKNKRPHSSKKPAAAAGAVSAHHQPTASLGFMFDGAMSHFGGGFDIGLGDYGVGGFSIDDVKLGNRMLSLEWPDQGCGGGGSEGFGYGGGIGMWGPSSAQCDRSGCS